MRYADYFVFFLSGLVALVFALSLVSRRLLLAPIWDVFLDGFRRVRIWHLAVATAAMALLLGFTDPYAARSGLPQLIIAAVVALLFVSAWAREFFALMALRDDDFPGRFDKPIWAALLIGLAPVGLFLFRSYRLAHWPEPRTKPQSASDIAEELA